MEDTVSVDPKFFDAPNNHNNPPRFIQTISKFIRQKLNDKVLDKVGLLIDLWDIQEIAKSFIYYGDGSHHTTVKFRYVVFRPYLNEVIEGKVFKMDKTGIMISLGFFHDVFVPLEGLPDISNFDEDTNTWIWEYADEEENGEEPQKFYIELNQPIRFRVTNEEFNPDSIALNINSENNTQKEPFRIIGSISESGLGMVSWWR